MSGIHFNSLFSIDWCSFLSQRKIHLNVQICIHLISAAFFFQQLHTKSFELTKVIHLLEDPLTVSETLYYLILLSALHLHRLSIFVHPKANLTERHLFTLKNLLKKSQIGFVSFSLNAQNRK